MTTSSTVEALAASGSSSSQSAAVERKSSLRRRKRHTAPIGAIEAARDMGVQWRSDCGRWLWHELEIIRLSAIADPSREICRQRLSRKESRQ